MMELVQIGIMVLGVATLGAVAGVFYRGFKWGYQKEEARLKARDASMYRCPKCHHDIPAIEHDRLIRRERRNIMKPTPGSISYCCNSPGCHTPIRDYQKIN